MKKMKLLGGFLALMIALSSCNKVEKILPKKEGKWDVTSIKTDEYIGGVLDTSYTETPVGGTIEFEKDGDGVMSEDGLSLPFTWTVNDDNDQVTLCITFITTDCITYDVLESEKDRQVWEGTQDWGGGDYDVLTMTIERAE